MQPTTIAAAAAAAAMLLSAPAQAADPTAGVLLLKGGEQRQIIVPFDDLDLASRSGQAVMLHRIQAAAAQVCGPRPSSIRELGAQLAFDRCVRASTGAGVGSLRQAAVTQAARRAEAAGSTPKG